MSLVVPDWPAPPRVQAFVTTRAEGDLAAGPARAAIRARLPSEPAWLRQVHGTRVVDASRAGALPEADASIALQPGVVCAVLTADCLPVLLADEAGGAVAAAHAGWRGLCAGVIEATVSRLGVPPGRMHAWLGPAIGPDAYEVGEEVREAFVSRDARAEAAFRATRPGHWHLDLYRVARQRLETAGVGSVSGGGFCTFREARRFFSHRRAREPQRMAALIWLA